MVLGLLAALLLTGCGIGALLPSPPWAGDGDDDDVENDDAAQAPCLPMPTEMVIGPADRPAEVKGPPGWCSNRELPVIFLLHGYGATATTQDFLFRLSARVELDRFLLVLPNGTLDLSGRRFWNGPPGCCDFYGAGVDDVGYLGELIDELDTLATIVPSRIYFAGHSNGGFMSYRMACEQPGRLGAIASLAGSGYPEASDCSSSEAVSVLQIHGELDATIPFAGGLNYPGAEELVERWASRAGCDLSAPEVGASLDLVNSISGSETEVTEYSDGCSGDHEVAMWRITNGSHVPYLNDTFAEKLVAWLLSH